MTSKNKLNTKVHQIKEIINSWEDYSSHYPHSVLSPLMELQSLLFRVVDYEERSGTVVVLRESDGGRVL